jgi:hypothetical protein
MPTSSFFIKKKPLNFPFNISSPKKEGGIKENREYK